MLTVISRPQGCKLSDTVNDTYSLTTDGYGTALLTGGTGINHGDKIFIYNSLESYNGFWVASGYGPGNYKLQRYPGGEYLEYKQDHDDISIYLCIADVDWSCAHLPIIYKLLSNLFPTNTGDTTRTISAFYNDNGFVKITLSGAIDIQPLDWLFISGNDVEELNGPFQVITRHSTTQYTINASYSLATSVYSYVSATAVRFYNNYHARVRIYGGLNASHEWASIKPYQLIVTEKILPDADNIVTVNVAEKIKEKLEILLNSPNQDSIPYDLDRFTQFYIEYAEAYDVSNGLTVTNTLQTYTSDKANFEGFGADAKLEFKNRYSGFLSNWIYGDANTPAKFLTYADMPVLFEGNYFDISFINAVFEGLARYIKKILKDRNENTIDTTYTEITNAESGGVIRQPLTVIGDEYFQDISLFGGNELLQPSEWTTAGFSDAFTTDATSFIFATDTVQKTLSVKQTVDIPSGSTMEAFSISIVNGGPSRDYDYQVTLYPAVQTIITGSGNIGGGSDLIPIPETLVTSDANELRVFVVFDSGSSTQLRVSLSVVGQLLSPNSIQYTETKTLEVNHDCYKDFIYLTWKNALGGFDYWLFTGYKDHNVNVLETQEKTKNIYPGWDRSWNEFADSITQETSRTSRKEFVIRSQYVTESQKDYISGIKTSHLVQQLSSKYDRRTMIVDAESFTVKNDGDKTYSIEFSIRFTNDIATQSL